MVIKSSNFCRETVFSGRSDLLAKLAAVGHNAGLAQPLIR
jgi:hypothetical protein